MSRMRSPATRPEISDIRSSIVTHSGCHMGRPAMPVRASTKNSRARRDGKSIARSDSPSP